jgi:hypothetical protein
MEGNRNDKYRSVKALAFGEGPRKSYLVSDILNESFRVRQQAERSLRSSTTDETSVELT